MKNFELDYLEMDMREEQNKVEEPTSEELQFLEEELNMEYGDMEIGQMEPDTDYIGDSLQLYLRDISRYPLLSAEEEKELGKQIMEGSPEISQIAKEKLTQSNLRLVLSVAQKYQYKGMELEDLNAMGIEGLIQAVDKFDYRRGFRFSTYAIWWIRQAVARGLADEGATVRIPVHMGEIIRKVNQAKSVFYAQNGKKAGVEDIAAITGLTEKTVETAMKAKLKLQSLDNPINDEEESTLEELIADKQAVDPCEASLQVELKDLVQKVLSKLPEKEAEVLRLRFGIGMKEPMTLEQIAKLPGYGVSRERVRQIEGSAVKMIRRSPSLMRMLEEYVA